MFKGVVGSIVKSRKVHATFLPFLIAVVVAALNGSVNEEQVTAMVKMIYENVIPVLVVAIAGEDIAKAFAAGRTGSVEASTAPPQGQDGLVPLPGEWKLNT